MVFGFEALETFYIHQILKNSLLFEKFTQKITCGIKMSLIDEIKTKIVNDCRHFKHKFLETDFLSRLF